MEKPAILSSQAVRLSSKAISFMFRFKSVSSALISYKLVTEPNRHRKKLSHEHISTCTVYKVYTYKYKHKAVAFALKHTQIGV